ncbi:sigma-70 family RNA polymerase sigma factor [Taklimakanibacter lacteus]|uniref:sigma-70 family RNA polymerase sigma factor n=1 Tax=Taklimakanibacter lacteus TaxID=2268456 RepID=UPI0013C5352C
MHVAHKTTEWTNAVSFPVAPAKISPAAMASKDRGYADETILAQLPTLKKYALKLTRSAHLAEDLVQDCLARALSRRHLFHSGANIRPWLFTVMHNLHVSNCRQSGVRLAFAKSQMAISSEGREATQEHVADLGRVFRAINTLPKEQRDVVVLVAVQELSYQEAADALAIPIGTVMSRLARGRDKIRMLLRIDAGKA